MSKDTFETQYDLTKKSRLREFYESKKILIYAFLITSIIIISSFVYYKESKENKRISLSNNYVQAKIYLEKENKTEALKILRNVVYSNDSIYSTLSFFMIMNENLIEDNVEVLQLFNHLLENNSYDEEIKNLLIYKKALYQSNYVEESKLLEEIKPLLKNKKSAWRGHALLLIGDFYFSKNHFIKAKDFYKQILTTENLLPDLYMQAKSKLIFITDD